jgi:CBS domain containing-hemolysin-like protein
VLHEFGHIPIEGESVELSAFNPAAPYDEPIRWRATVTRMDGRRIDLLDLVQLGARGAGPDE